MSVFDEEDTKVIKMTAWACVGFGSLTGFLMVTAVYITSY